MRNRRPSPRGKDVAKRGNPLRPLRVAAILLFCAFIFPVLPKMQLNAAHTFSSGPVVITQETVNTYGREFIIENGVFSVTVTDGVDVTIIFNNVKIDRRYDTPGSLPGVTSAQLLEAAKKLNSDSLSEDSKWESYGQEQYYIPTCPLLITGGASVTARFAGSCSFYAGFNGWYISENVGTMQNDEGTNMEPDYDGGYAGIQVDSGSSLTIASAYNLRAVGAYQFITDMNDSTTVKDIIDQNTVYNSKDPWVRPAGCEEGVTGGGAGIGGGVSYNNQRYGASDYRDGTPGRITINGGNITAVGGHQAAGIGGGVNSASTSSEIVINGGEITAIGGRFATGVGDGDSYNTGTSYAYRDDHSITVNGGRLHAYGGTSAAGLGTTDHVSSSQGFEGKYHGLEITVNGGTVYATSGEATANTSATAAVGSGEGTNMQDNSITISSASRVIGASFSQYAISNYGTDASKTPMIHIDPLGYMYLVRFDSATQDRVFKLYPVRKDVNGNRMFVAAESSAVSSINAENYEKYRFYAYDPGKSKYYRVDGLGYTVDENGERSNDRYYPGTIESLSVFYDFSAPIGTLTVPGKYKAIAMSLFDPSLFGGAYVLEVPKGDTSESSIFVSIVKDSPGVTSGRVEYTGDFHVSAGENGKSEETPNISIDKTANGFKDISLYVQGTDTDYITEFSPSTYGYTVYLPYGTTKFTIHSEYALSDAVSRVTIDGTGLKIRELIYEEDKEGAGVMKNDVSMNIEGYDRGDFWIRKEDTDGTYIVYRIVVNVKKMYTLELAGSDKVYDGVAAQGRAEGISEGPDGQTQGSGLPELTDQDRAQIVYTWYRDANGNGAADTDESLTQPPRNAGKYIVCAYLEASTFEAKGEARFEISKREITLNAIENWTAYFSLEELAVFDGYIKNPGKLFFGNVVAGESITVDIGFSVKFTDPGNNGYSDDVGYSLDKIEVSSLVLTGDSALNYTLVPDEIQGDGPVFLVYGQITYKTDGAIFRKVLDAAAPFRKFYPVDSDTFLDFENDDPRRDYHSPDPDIHRDYVYLHTVNKGENEAVYAVDIEFGTMQFSYSKTTWNVDDYTYVENDGSVWSGNDGVSNSVRVINYSNRDISFQVSAQIDFIYGPVGGNQNSGITCSLQIDDGDAAVPVKDGESLLVPMAKPASTASAGVPGERCVEVVLSGVPQIGENVLTAVGKVTVMVSRDVLQGSYAGTGGGSA